MFKEIVDDGHRVNQKAPLGHIVLRWAKKKKKNKFGSSDNPGLLSYATTVALKFKLPTQQPLLWNSNFNMLTQ